MNDIKIKDYIHKIKASNRFYKFVMYTYNIHMLLQTYMMWIQ